MDEQPGPTGNVEPDEERFERMFLSRISARIAESFTDEQLLAIKSVFGAEHWDGHAFDLRLTLPIPFRRWYVVLLGGPERRVGARRRKPKRTQRSMAFRYTMDATVGALAVIWLGLILYYLVAV